MRTPPAHSKFARDLLGLACLTLLFAAWALVTLFPEGGLGSARETLVRAAIAGGGVLLLALVLSWPLKAHRLVEWSPLRDLYHSRRERRTQRILATELERGERQRAPYRAIEALPRYRESA
jgi:hypothetical protein